MASSGSTSPIRPRGMSRSTASVSILTICPWMTSHQTSRHDNCVYPRALVGKDTYSGNRFEYESSVNDLAWKLTWLNADSLAGKRGLIQRAVDSYRNRTPESRSRRVLRQQKLQEGVLRRRSTGAHDMLSPNDDLARYSGNPRTITFQYTSKSGETLRTKLRVDIDSVDINQISEDFKKANCVYPAVP